MIVNIYFKVKGKLQVKKVDWFSYDVAKDLSKFSLVELQKMVGIKSGAVLVVVK